MSLRARGTPSLPSLVPKQPPWLAPDFELGAPLNPALAATCQSQGEQPFTVYEVLELVSIRKLRYCCRRLQFWALLLPFQTNLKFLQF